MEDKTSSSSINSVFPIRHRVEKMTGDANLVTDDESDFDASMSGDCNREKDYENSKENQF